MTGRAGVLIDNEPAGWSWTSLVPMSGTHDGRVESGRFEEGPATRTTMRIAVYAPGGNRTRGLRFERPLLFGSPKRTVDH